MADVTIYTLAKELNMAPSMVSRAFNPACKVSKQKRKLILETAEKYGFSPNKMASRLSMKKIKIGTLICVVGVGPIIDLGVKVVSYFPVESANIFIKMLLVLAGCFIIAIGFSIMSASNIGVAPNDIVPFIIQDKLKCQYRWIRIAMDATFLVVGFILGGKVGVGTIISMLAIGPFIQFCLPYGKKVVDFILKDKEEINSESTVIV